MRPKTAQSFHPHERTQTTTTGYIYILTNPSFPQYGKLGYATDVKQRLAELNRSTAVPFAFRVYATYEVDSALSDKKLNSILDKLNPDLRSAEEGVKPHQTFCHPCKRQIILHKRSPMLPVNESDWKLFRKRLPEWQERCMEQLAESYAALLAGPGKASDKFWELEKRLRKDKKRVGVVADVSRSKMYYNLLYLLGDKTITLEDLAGFSPDLRERLAMIARDHFV